MENIDIRKYIISNFNNDGIEKIRDSINTTIEYQSEEALIGLGVFFELIWKKLDDNSKNDYLKLIYDSIKEANH